MKHEILFEWYAIKAKTSKAIDFYLMWRKWCNSFDNNYAKEFDKSFKD